MIFDQVRGNGFRLEAYFKGELVALRVRRSIGWVTVPLERQVTEQDMVWKQPGLPEPRKKGVGKIKEPEYIKFEEAP